MGQMLGCHAVNHMSVMIVLQRDSTHQVSLPCAAALRDHMGS
jgi:hypothetical protein